MNLNRNPLRKSTPNKLWTGGGTEIHDPQKKKKKKFVRPKKKRIFTL